MAPISSLSGSQGAELIRSAKNHPRYRLRMIAIGSVTVGIFLNILSIALCDNNLLYGLAFVPLCISMIWHIIDLVLRPLHKPRFPQLIAFVDALGFCSFLALIIVNGVVAANRRWWRANGAVILMTYTSVPWMICCVIHGFIALQNIFYMLTESAKSLLVCSECSRSWKAEQKKPQEATDQAHYSLLGPKDDHEYDVEADGDSKYMGSNTNEESIHVPAVSDQTT